GLPLAMVILSAIVVPAYRNARVYTAYEFLERRFDGKTRTLTSIVFLVQRGLGVGMTLYAPSVVLSILLGWPEHQTILIMGALVISYTVAGGIKAVTWTDVQQMSILFVGIIVSLTSAVVLLPRGVS